MKHHKLKDKLSAVWIFLIGDELAFVRENISFNVVSIITLAILFIFLPFNYYIKLPVLTVLVLVLIILQCIFYYYSRVKKKYRAGRLAYAVISYIALSICYFYNAGINGPTIFIFFLTFQFLLAFTNKKQHLLWILLHVFVVIGLFIFNIRYPAAIPNTYQNQTYRFADISVSYVVTLIFTYFVTIYLINNYIKEKKKAEKWALSVAEQNKKIMAQNEELDKLNHEKDKLFSIISHDLRSPLATIQGYLELITDASFEMDDEMDVKKDLLFLTKNTSEMLYNLLMWSKTQMGGAQPELNKIQVHSIIEKVMAVQGTIAANKKINILSNIDASIEIMADSDMLQLIIRNLLNNAIKYTVTGDDIYISAYRKGNDCIISVKDNGVGIPKEIQAEIFSFKTKSSAGTQSEKGIGIGLALCKEFTELQNGTLRFTSEPGTGTEFFVNIALAH